jgi:hypothetical protein
MPAGLFTSDGFNSDLTNDLNLAEAALAQLADGSGREALPERPCARCGHEIPWERGRRGARAIYCSDACRKRHPTKQLSPAAGVGVRRCAMCWGLVRVLAPPTGRQ